MKQELNVCLGPKNQFLADTNILLITSRAQAVTVDNYRQCLRLEGKVGLWTKADVSYLF